MSLVDMLLAPLRPLVQRRSIDVLRVRHVDLAERGLGLGLRIAVASDLHARNDWFPREHVARVVDAINDLEGIDLVLLLGDFVGDDLSAIDWYTVMACFKLGIVLEGTHARAFAGKAPKEVGDALHATTLGLFARARSIAKV